MTPEEIFRSVYRSTRRSVIGKKSLDEKQI